MHDSECPGDFCPTLVLDSAVCSCVMVLWLLTFTETRLQTPRMAPLGATAMKKRDLVLGEQEQGPNTGMAMCNTTAGSPTAGDQRGQTQAP